jgi:zinc protease
VRLAWHTPALFAPGDADLDLAAHVLAGGKSSRLYRSLVFEQRIAQDVFAYQGSQQLGSMFQVGATAKPGRDLPEIVRAVDAEIERLAGEGPTDGELARARNTHLADFYKSLDHLQTRADLLNHYQNLLGDPNGVERDVARYTAATCASVRDAFARALGGKRLALRTLPEPDRESA